MTEAVSDTCAQKSDPLDVPKWSGIDSETICNPELLTLDRSNRNSGLIISMASVKRVMNRMVRDYVHTDIFRLLLKLTINGECLSKPFIFRPNIVNRLDVQRKEGHDDMSVR